MTSTQDQIKGFDPDLNSFFSVRFQWALHQFRLADQFEAAEESARVGLTTPATIADFGQRVRRVFLDAIGGLVELPHRVDWETVRQLESDRIRVDLIRFESLPGLVVPGALYHPNRDDPGPAVFIASGHCYDAKAYPEYQRLALELAGHGFTVLIIDPMGLGERAAWLNPNGSVYRQGSFEHNYMGVPCHLIGQNLGRYMIHDGRCSVSLLGQLDQVDTARIAVTGHSGGGRMTSYLALCDDRIAATVPVCHICDQYRHMVTARGSDAEMMIYGSMANGLNSADPHVYAAPKPVLLGGVKSDIFPSEGFMIEVERIRKIYETLGAEDQFEYCLTPGHHAYNQLQRHRTIQFLCRHFNLGEPRTLRDDSAIPVRPEEDFFISSTGNIYRDQPGLARPNEINKRQWKQMKRPKIDREALPLAVAEALDLEPNQLSNVELFPKVITEQQLDGGQIQYLSIMSQWNLDLGGIAFVPEGPIRQACLYLTDRGANEAKQADNNAFGRMRRGTMVLYADVRGRGAVEASLINYLKRNDRYGTEHWFASSSVLMGNSVLAQRTHDVLRWIDYLKRTGVDFSKVKMVGQGQTGLSVLLGSVLAGQPASFEWIDPLPDWDEVLEAEDYDYGQFNESVIAFGIAKKFSMQRLLEHVNGHA